MFQQSQRIKTVVVSREILIITEGFAFPMSAAWDAGKGNTLLDQRHAEPTTKSQYNSLRLFKCV